MQYTWQVGIGSIPLILNIQYDYTPVSGIIPTAEVYRQSDDFILDWINSEFVSVIPSGGSKFGTMTELSINGIYRVFFNPESYDSFGANKYLIVYRAIIPSGYNGIVNKNTYVTISEIHSFENVASGSFSSTTMAATFVE